MTLVSTSAAKNLRDRYSALAPSVLLGEIMQKRWSEAIAPFTLLVISIVASAFLIEGYLSLGSIISNARAFSEFLFLVLAMALIMLGGGIDLSVAATYSLANFVVLLLIGQYEWPLGGAVAVALVMGAVIGVWNGLLVGYIKTRPFITTITTLIILKALVNLLDQIYSAELAAVSYDNSVWTFLGSGSILGIPVNAVALIITAILGHIVLSRSRYGAHIYATGGDRRAALHAGIDIRWVQLTTYIVGGILAAIGGIFYAARFESASSNVGSGMELMVLTAVALGGIRLAGGRGSFPRAIIGGLIVLILTNALVRFGLGGSEQSMIIGFIALVAVGAEVRYNKNRARATDMVYIAPASRQLGRVDVPSRSAQGPLAVNDELRDSVQYGELEAISPGDMLFDRQRNLYVSTGEGWILKYTPESFYRRRRYWSHTGGRPLGMQLDRDGTIVAAVVGRGIFRIGPDGIAKPITSETERSLLAVRDDSRIRIPTDLDIAPDGKIFFGEGSVRYELYNWLQDSLEGRGNGALLMFDPATGKTRSIVRGLPFCGGVCVTHDGSRVLVSLSWSSSIFQYHLTGPKAGKFEPLIAGLPGYPMMMNRSSDGAYWVAVIGMRSPAYDVAMRMARFRKRMTRHLPLDEWLTPNFNAGLVLKISDSGEILQSLWDPLGRNHAMVTSVREDAGYLHLASWNSSKFGRKDLHNDKRDWSAPAAFWSGADRS